MSEQAVFDALKYRIEVDEDGTRFYYNSAGLWHREHGPAIELADNSKYWYQNGLLHRTNGAAIEWPDGSMEWFVNGEELTEAEFNQRVKKCLNKMCLMH